MLWISPNSWVAHRTTHGGKLGRPNPFSVGRIILTYLHQFFFSLLLTQNLHVFRLIMFPLIESWVAHRATSGVMLDRPTASWITFGDWVTTYPQHWIKIWWSKATISPGPQDALGSVVVIVTSRAVTKVGDLCQSEFTPVITGLIIALRNQHPTVPKGWKRAAE